MKWAAALLCLLGPAIVGSQKHVDARRGDKQTQEFLYVWSGDQLKAFAPGFEDLLADLYWLRTVQYYGGQRAYAEHPDYELLAPLADITTQLDPRLQIAYRYAAIFLSEPYPTGAGKPLAGIELLARGTKAMPANWRLRQDLGFFHFVYLNDASRAAQILGEAAAMPGAAFWLKTLAARVLEKGGQRQQARLMWQTMFAQGEDGAIRENARVNLGVLDALDARDAVQAKVDNFRAAHGRFPGSLEELLGAGLISRPAADTTGKPYDYNASSGKVNIAQGSRVYRTANRVH